MEAAEFKGQEEEEAREQEHVPEARSDGRLAHR